MPRETETVRMVLQPVRFGLGAGLNRACHCCGMQASRMFELDDGLPAAAERCAVVGAALHRRLAGAAAGQRAQCHLAT